MNLRLRSRLWLGQNLRGEKNFLIFNLGGGTFDVSVLIIGKGELFEEPVILHASGWRRLENRVVDYFSEKFKPKSKKDLKEHPRALRRLRTVNEPRDSYRAVHKQA